MAILESTESLCPKCLGRVRAQVTYDEKSVYLERTCPEHGFFKGLVWSDLQRYRWSFRLRRPPTPFAKIANKVEKGCPFDCGLCPEHKQHTCLAILEITNHCNIKCPICFASSDKGSGFNLKMDDIEYALRSFLEHEGRPSPLQLSGGEPTVRSDLEEIIKMARHLGFNFVELNTNGIELARSPGLAKAYAEAGLTGIYLQFDGITDDIYQATRGIDLVKIKDEAITNCRKAGLNVVFGVTVVKGLNDHQLWDIVQYALKRMLSGVNFQPFAMFGRYPMSYWNPLDRITNPDIARLLETQSGGLIKVDDFIPVPCPDNRCQMLAYLTVRGKNAMPINRLFDVEPLLDLYKRFTDYEEMEGAIKDLRKMLYEMWSTSARAGLLAEHDEPDQCITCLPHFTPGGRFFAIASHGMMDVWNVDVHRLKECCIHELTPEGRLIPLCLYNITSMYSQPLYRNARKIRQKLDGSQLMK